MSDALDRLKSRKRPKVRQRDASLGSTSPDIQTYRHTDVDMSESQDIVPPETQDIKTSRQPDSPKNPAEQPSNNQTDPDSDISQSRHLSMQTSTLPSEDLQVKRSTFRMEEALTERLHTLCRQQKISREVLMEAMFEYMEAHPDALDQVLAVATEKNAHRQHIANRKRAEAMMQKFGGS